MRLAVTHPHRRQLQEVARGNDLAAAERLITSAQSAKQKLDEIQLPTRQHRDFINDQHFTAAHPAEAREDGTSRIPFEHGEVVVVRLPRSRSEQHPAEPMNRHAALVQRRDPGRCRDVHMPR